MDEIKIMHGGLSIDDRGSVRFVNDFDFTGVKRMYQVENHRSGFIRAWHGHKLESKYVYVVSGSALIGTVSMDNDKITTMTLSAKQPKVLYIPPRHYNGFKTLEDNTIILFFSTSTLDESLNDDIREDYDKWNIWGENFR